MKAVRVVWSTSGGNYGSRASVACLTLHNARACEISTSCFNLVSLSLGKTLSVDEKTCFLYAMATWPYREVPCSMNDLTLV